MPHVPTSARAFPACSVPLGILLATAAAAQEPEQYTIAARELAVFNLAGVVRVEASADSTFALEVVRHGRDAELLRVDTGTVGGRLTLRVVYPGGLVVYPDIGGTSAEVLLGDDGRFRDATAYAAGDVGRRVAVKGVGAGTEAAADIVARMPAGARLSVYLAAGRLMVTDVMGALELDSRAAQVDVQGMRGALRVVSWTGGVRVRDVDGPVAVDGGVGGVDLAGIRGPRLAVDAGIGAASVTDVDVAELALWVGPGRVGLADIRAETIQAALGSGSLDLGLAGDVQSMKVEAASGDVTVHASDALGAEIEVHAGAGAFSTDLPIEVSERRDERLRSYVAGKLGDGQGKIEIASAGKVRLLKEAR
jgi:hypothetical protein